MDSGKITMGSIDFVRRDGTDEYRNFDSIDYITAVLGAPQDPVVQQFWDAHLRYSLGIYPVVCAIARDMFVLEEREAHYHVKRNSKKAGKKKRTRQTRNYVWLPREEVTFRPHSDYERTVTEVAPAHVTGHRRRLRPGHRASDKQLNEAAGLGVVIPAGYTYVSEHHRGGYTTGPDFKSRSALQMMFS
jgi:hypothetical protein